MALLRRVFVFSLKMFVEVIDSKREEAPLKRTMSLVLLYCLQIIQADKGDSQDFTEEAKKLGMHNEKAPFGRGDKSH